MRVADLMTTNVAGVRMNELCADAVQLMWDRDCGGVPVLDENGSSVIGMITDRDVCIATWTQRRPPQEIFVSEAMSSKLHSCLPEDSIAAVEELMRTKQVRRIPVLDPEGRLIGIVSLADIARHGAREHEPREVPDVVPDEIAATLAHICAPRTFT